MSSCGICQSTERSGEWTALEMMVGSREPFRYFQCASCDCLQIETVPDDLSRHYATGYYSFHSPKRAGSSLKRWAARSRDEFAVFNRGVAGRLLYGRWPVPTLQCLRPLGLSLNSRVLDVGCGAGDLVSSLAELGFKCVEGVDPFIPHAIQYDNGAKVTKAHLGDLSGTWDVVMFNHSFEHLPDPMATLQRVHTMLAPGGVCMLRVPTVSSWAWEHYGVDWVQLDAPRHLFLFATKTMDVLARRAGFVVRQRVCDSTRFQFWGSEQYRHGIALNAPNSYDKNPAGGLFTTAQMRGFDRQSAALNREGRGDQAAFYLVRQP
jgi:SAM-dependent methyltransferase